MAMKLSSECSPIEFLKAYNPDLQSTISSYGNNISSFSKIKDAYTLATVKLAYGESTAINFLKINLIRLNEFVGTKEKLDDLQLQDLSEQILSEFYYLNVFEFIFFFSKLRSGKYVDFYGSVDPMRILKSLSNFVNDRRNEIEREEREINRLKKEAEFDKWKRDAVSYEQYKVMVAKGLISPPRK